MRSFGTQEPRTRLHLTGNSDSTYRNDGGVRCGDCVDLIDHVVARILEFVHNKEANREIHQLRRRRSLAASNHCEHKQSKVIDGNRIRCGTCNTVVGFVRKPEKS